MPKYTCLNQQAFLLLQLLGRIDRGAAFAIDQIPIKSLQQLLADLFDNLLLHKTKQAGAALSTLQQQHATLSRTEAE